jgi:hypothetical protein
MQLSYVGKDGRGEKKKLLEKREKIMIINKNIF